MVGQIIIYLMGHQTALGLLLLLLSLLLLLLLKGSFKVINDIFGSLKKYF